ncbi:hypothetical protein QJS10_CPB19g00353 [Acorus calamus]|uniref:Uncharacterized protein n=1 Tax=Acorus calamus TaxID=4465 RepID=A0AAV9CGP8_ACOCL|nr:hypothetical protein QJS10_CPB19g00353 [Acorus calamus]
MRTSVNLSGMTIHSSVGEFHTRTSIGPFSSQLSMSANSTSMSGFPNAINFNGMSAQTTSGGMSFSIGGLNVSGPSTQTNVHHSSSIIRSNMGGRRSRALGIRGNIGESITFSIEGSSQKDLIGEVEQQCSDVIVPYVGMTFDSEDDIRMFYNNYAQKKGFGIAKIHRIGATLESRYNPEDKQSDHRAQAPHAQKNASLNHYAEVQRTKKKQGTPLANQPASITAANVNQFALLQTTEDSDSILDAFEVQQIDDTIPTKEIGAVIVVATETPVTTQNQGDLSSIVSENTITHKQSPTIEEVEDLPREVAPNQSREILSCSSTRERP